MCTVSPFLPEYDSTENIEICTAATAWTNEDGRTYILVFGQGLWFGDRLDRSLINPNQCRAFGISLCDDPTDPHRSLGFHTEKVLVELYMNGTIATMLTHCPSQEELDTCPFIYLSDQDSWDPTKVNFQINSIKQETSDKRPLKICQIESTAPTAPNITLMPSTASSYDIAMANVSTTLCQDIFVSDLLDNVHVYQVSSSKSTKPTPAPLPDLQVNTFTHERHHRVTPEALAQKWNIGLNTARKTIKVTTQLGVRSAIGPLTRRYRTDILQNHLRRLNTTFYTDTLFAKCKSIVGNTVAQVYTDGQGFVHVDPRTSKAFAGLTLDALTETVGVPNKLIYDGSQEQIGPKSHFQKSMRKHHIQGHQTEPYSQWQNRAEDSVRELKRRWKRRMIKRRAPKRVWDFGFVYEAEILSRIARGRDGRTGIERLTGDSCDISEWIDFEFYDLCWYWDTPHDSDNPKIGRWLGVSHRIGSAMCYWILNDSGNVLSRTTVQHVTRDEIANPEIMERIRIYHDQLESVIGNDQYVSTDSEFNQFINEDIPDPNEDIYNKLRDMGKNEEPFQGYDIPEIDDFITNSDKRDSEDVYDSYLGAEILLPDHDGNKMMAKVIKRVKGNDGNPIGTKHSNPVLDSSEYVVEMSDGSTQELTANLIAESMYSQVDSEGHHYQLMAEISDHRKDRTAIPISNGMMRSRNGNMVPKKTTRGWELLVEWKDGSSSWVPLKDLKVSNPVEVAEYAAANQIDQEPAFKWWVKDTLRRRNRIISKVKSKYWRTTHKFGIRIPKTVEEALALDKENGNALWHDAIQKEMKNVRVAFQAWDGGTVEDARRGDKLVGYQEIKCHMIFDIKMDGLFTRKARFVAGGHTTNTPSSITYSSVVSRDSVRIAFTLAALNGLKIKAADIGNAYLNAKCREKIWTVAGTEFGSDKGRVLIICRALYGLKSSGAAWRLMLAQTLSDLGYTSTKADPDVWLKAETKPNGDEYYAYILVYVDDILHIHHNPDLFMNCLEKIYRLKDNSTGEPERYLGSNIEKVQLENGDITWSMHSREYVQNAIRNLEQTLKNDGAAPLKVFGKRAGERPFPANYRPELDVSPLLKDELANRYLQLIGILRWAVELGRMDIIAEVSVLSQHQCQPREGHLAAVYRIFWYLKCKTKDISGRIVFDSAIPKIDEQIFTYSDPETWKEFYPDAQESLPPNAPPPRGKDVRIASYVDADHAGNLVTRRSHTGIIIYLNNAPIIWFSKRQNTVESSSFGSEFVALRISTDLIEALRYKLRMFGVPIDGPADIFCDNKSVATNASVPTSVLNKRHNAICYHRVREAHTAGIVRVGWIEGEYNKADIATKTTIPTKRRFELLSSIFNENVESVGPPIHPDG